MILNKIVNIYMSLAITHGISRGLFYHYDKKRTSSENFFVILSVALINPAYICYSLNHDLLNIKLYNENKQLNNKDWFY